jgi:hypothetical protein
MTALGWVFMILSVGFVWVLTGWCFYRVLTLPPTETIPEQAQDFRSA